MDPKKTTQGQTKGTESKQSTGTGPNPARFNKYDVLPDESGFRIPGSDHIFEFDTHGGWFDEYDNYYNADGQPATPPEYDEDNLGDFDDIADALAREYDMYDDDDGEEHLGHYDNIYLNIENKRVLANYLKDQEINIEIRNMNYNSTEADFESFLKNKHIEFIEFEFEYDNRDRFRGICYITLDKINAEKLIEFNGSKLSGRDVKINVLKPDEEEDTDVPVTGGEGLTAGPQKQEEQKTQWRAPVEKPKEEATTAQPQTQATTTQAGSELEKDQPKPSGYDRNQNQNQGRYQNQNQNYQRNQGYNQNQGSRQNYQQNRGNQQNYQKQGQSGIQRNYSGPSQNQYQGQQYQQNQYSQQNYNQGYTGAQNAYQYQGYQQQWGGYPQNQYPVQGGYPQQYNYGGMPQGQFYGHGQQQGYYQQSGSFPSQGGQAQGAQADAEDTTQPWGKPLKKKEQGK